MEFLGESKEANRAGQIDQLNDLRFKTQMGNKNLSRGTSEKIPENETPGKDKDIQEEET